MFLKNAILGSLLFLFSETAYSDDLLSEVKEIVQKNYVKNINNFDEIIVKEGLKGLDPHSSYIENPQNLKQITSGLYSGIGIEIYASCSHIIVASVINESPAERAGIQQFDILLKADDISFIGKKIDSVRNALQGKIGTFVNLTVLRNGKEITFKVKRDNIQIQNSFVKLMHNDEIAYIKIKSFSNGVSENIQQAYNKIQKNSLQGVILDLRYNPGGTLEEAINVSSLFLNKSQKIVSLQFSKEKIKDFFSNGYDITNSLPMVVLINAASASASEIVASALQDSHRAQVVGMQSFGKGSVQTAFSLSNGAMIKLTTALYQTPTGQTIQGRGVKPDIVVEEGIAIQQIPMNESIFENKLQNALPSNIFTNEKELQRVQLHKSVIGNEDKDFQLMSAISVIKTMMFLRNKNMSSTMIDIK